MSFITLSGREVSIDSGVPSLEDIAIALERMPRFGGQCRVPWSVAQHSLLVHDLTQGGDYTKLLALLHDSHEYMGDIPTPFKTACTREIQRKLDERLWKAIGFWPTIEDLAAVKAADLSALDVESRVVGPTSGGSDGLGVLAKFKVHRYLDDVRALIKKLGLKEP